MADSKQSVIWAFFSKIEGAEKCKCNNCAAEILCQHGNTTNAAIHLKLKHSEKHTKHTNQVRMGIKYPLHLMQSVDTRWNSEMQRELRPKKLSGPLAVSLTESDCTDTKTPNDWNLSKVFTTVLNGVDIATSETSTEVYSSISKTIPSLSVMSSKFQSCKLKAELKDFAVVFDKHLLLRFPNLMRSSSIHVTAMVLNPRYKNVLLSEVGLNNAKMKARQFFNEEEVFVVSRTPVEEEENDEKFWSVFERFKKQKLFSRLEENKDSCDNQWNAYLAEPVINRTDCHLRWWNDNKSRFPKLALRAQRLLAIPVTAVLSRRHWSDSGNLITAGRESLAPETYRELVFCEVVRNIMHEFLA